MVQTDYAKPTNRSQTTTQNGFCNYSIATGKEIFVLLIIRKLSVEKSLIFLLAIMHQESVPKKQRNYIPKHFPATVPKIYSLQTFKTAYSVIDNLLHHLLFFTFN